MVIAEHEPNIGTGGGRCRRRGSCRHSTTQLSISTLTEVINLAYPSSRRTIRMLPLRLHTAASHAALRRARVSSPKAAWVSWETTPIVPASTQALHYLMAAVEDPGRRPTNYATKNLSATQRTGQLKHHLSASNNQLINIYTTNTTSEATPTMAQASLPTRGTSSPSFPLQCFVDRLFQPHHGMKTCSCVLTLRQAAMTQMLPRSSLRARSAHHTLSSTASTSRRMAFQSRHSTTSHSTPTSSRLC